MLFMKTYNLQMTGREIIAEDYRVMADLLKDTVVFDEKIGTMQKEINGIMVLNNAHVHTYAATGADKVAFEQKAVEYDSRLKKAEAQLEKLKVEWDEYLARSKMIKCFFVEMLNVSLVLIEWLEQLWNTLVRKAVISSDDTVAFTFKEKTIMVVVE